MKHPYAVPTRARALIRNASVLLSALMIPGSALATYPSSVEQLLFDHTDHQFAFGAAPILGRVGAVTREDGLRKGLAVLQAIGLPGGVAPIDVNMIVAEYNQLEPARLAAEAEGTRYHRQVTLPDGTILLHRSGATVVMREDEFQLVVSRHGHGYRIRLPANDAGELGNQSFQPSLAQAESLGLAQIQSLGLVPTAEQSQLFTLKARRIRFTGKAADPGDRAVATVITFGRELSGIPFVGEGSHVRFEFTYGNRIASLSVDWPPIAYEPSTQTVASKQSFEARIAGTLRADSDDGLLPSQVVLLHSILCGYYDPGARADEPYLELACEVGLSLDDSPTPQVVVVPLGSGYSAQLPWGGTAGIAAMEAKGLEPGIQFQFIRHAPVPLGD